MYVNLVIFFTFFFFFLAFNYCVLKADEISAGLGDIKHPTAGFLSTEKSAKPVYDVASKGVETEGRLVALRTAATYRGVLFFTYS